MKKLLIAALIAGSMMFAPIASASVETYTGKGEYVMSNFETPDIAQQRAQKYAERDAQEQAGVFIRSRSKVENFHLTEDEIITMSAGIVKILNVDIQPVVIDEHNFKFIATVTVNINNDEINRWLAKEAQERFELVEQNKELRRKIEEQDKEIASLKKQSGTSTNEQDRSTLEKKFRQADDAFLAIEKLREGNRLTDHNEALAAYSEAIRLDPNYAMAYNNRGYTYTELKQYDRAMTDLNRAIELDPKNDLAYNNRGRVFARRRQYDQAIADYNKAIELNPNYAKAYNNRGYVYDDLKQYERAIADYTKAIELNPSFAMAYNNRGFTFIGMKNFERAILDFDKALEIKPDFDWAYNNRGNAYYHLKQYDKALSDYSRAIECNPNYAKAYNNRGMIYKLLGDTARAQADFDKATALGG